MKTSLIHFYTNKLKQISEMQCSTNKCKQKLLFLEHLPKASMIMCRDDEMIMNTAT